MFLVPELNEKSLEEMSGKNQEEEQPQARAGAV